MPGRTVNINPEVLKWARESAHMELVEIPKSVISSEKLLDIENGKKLPSFVELQKLAKKYGRPLGILLGDTIPEIDYLNIPFFRKEKKTDYDSALTMYIRDIQEKQDWARNYLIFEGFSDLDFIGSFQFNEDPVKVAQGIKERLDLPDYSKFNHNEDYLKALRSSFEANNIFVSITGSNLSNKPISIEQAQGFAIVDEYAPFIFINTKNTTNAKIFTLIHEVVHLFLNESGISEDTFRFRKPECKEDEIENFCNTVAGEVLMPTNVFISRFNKLSDPLEVRISKLSKQFLVSELAVCVKLWKQNQIEYKQYQTAYVSIKEKIDEYLKTKRKKQKDTKGGDYYNNMRSKNGALLSSLVFTAYKSGDILSRDLSQILRIKTNSFDKYFATV
ncbi:MAG: ImmA/IrrE family metallo-endopeptidase [Bacteroidales bacterium]|nr:ImmA/IrrE family metallo-endopeptidase [Bacteroidales bacterium]